MNSSDLTLSGRLEESHSNNQVSTSDSNANVNNGTHSKGAIPKTKPVKQNPSKKPNKLNNNEDILIPKNGSNLMEDVFQLHSESLRLNGYSDSLSKISGSYLDDYKSVLFRNNSDSCENCSIKTNGSVHLDNKETNDHLEVNSFIETPTMPSYQTSTTLRETDLNLLIKVDVDSNSSDENELLSISDDGCIYTYKGDQAADLPSSFFSLDLPLPRSPEATTTNRLENVSPEMDYLEMDFDPGPSGDADSDSQSNADLENTENLPEDLPAESKNSKAVEIDANKSLSLPPTPSTSQSTENGRINVPEGLKVVNPIPSTSSTSSIDKEPTTVASSITERIREICSPWANSLSNRTTSSRMKNNFSKRLHCCQGEFSLGVDKPSSPGDDVTVVADDLEKISLEDNYFSETAMIWSEEEASRKQITQIGASACGATAVLNVLNALRLPIPSIEVVREAVKTRLRTNSSPLTEYLLSRSVAGSTHEDLINGLHKLSDGQVYSRFFHLYPERILNLNLWLHFWITHGAVPIVTLNLQKCSGTIPDAWHHQMVYGIGPRGIYLTNPLDCVEVGQLWPQLSSESILLIRKDDVLSRWNAKTDLRRLININDERWRSVNVVGQVANLIRENRRELRPGFANTTHIKIPAAYSAGITLVMRKDAPLCPLLVYYPDLPLLPNEEQAVGFCDCFY